MRAEYYLTPYLSFGGEYDNSDQNNSSEELFLNFRYNLGKKLSQKTNNMQSDTAKIWDRRYDEVIRENKIYLEEKLNTSKMGITAPTGLSGTAGSTTTVSAALTISNGYSSSTMGAVTYSIDGNKKGAEINSSTGAVDLSGASVGVIKIKATIAAKGNYDKETSIYDFTINFNNPTFGNIVNLSKQLNSNGVTVSSSPNLTNAPTNYNSVQHGNRTFTVTSATNNVSTSNISVDSSTGAVTASAGTVATVVTVTVSTAGGTKYGPGSKTYTVTFTKSDAPSLTFDDPNQVAWGTQVSVVTPTAASNYNQTQMGALSYSMSGTATGISVAANGTVTATQPGSVIVKVSTTGGTKYNAGSNVGTYTVTFTKKNAPNLLFSDPNQVAWGTSVSAVTPTAASNYDQNEMGALSYVGSAVGISVATNGTVTATQPGSVTVTVSTDGGTKYKAGNVGTYTVTFTKKNALNLSFAP